MKNRAAETAEYLNVSYIRSLPDGECARSPFDSCVFGLCRFLRLRRKGGMAVKDMHWPGHDTFRFAGGLKGKIEVVILQEES